VSTPAGFRTTVWTGGQGGAAPFELNGEGLKFRGFSHHNSIGGLGVALSERVELFRVQASRALGSNIWRMSHNPYQKPLYDLLDATGVMCWDGTYVGGAKLGWAAGPCGVPRRGLRRAVAV
jgi:beta-galactosidase